MLYPLRRPNRAAAGAVQRPAARERGAERVGASLGRGARGRARCMQHAVRPGDPCGVRCMHSASHMRARTVPPLVGRRPGWATAGPAPHGPADPEPAPWPPCARMDSSTGQASPRSRRRWRPRPREFLFARALSRRRHRAPRAPPPVDPISIAELPYEEPTSKKFPAARAVAVSLQPKGRRARALRARASFFLDI